MTQVVNRVVAKAEFNKRLRTGAWAVIDDLRNGIVCIRVAQTGNLVWIKVKETP